MNTLHADAAPASAAGQDTEKRRQILAGARDIFLAHGFDGASMGEIARSAGVSKGTLYVYFGSKQELFAALVGEECSQTAELTFEMDENGTDLRSTLMRMGVTYVHAMIRPEHIATVRTVIAVAEKFPEVGHAFLKAGPRAGVARLSAWLRGKESQGLLRIGDTDLAAWQFLMGCHASIAMPMLFASEPAPSDGRIEEVVTQMVEMFLRAYARER
ncbi:TetR/AcrR family transcriptional regulator [Ancylobacter terrae]|uniref:TetR/AcrR family transcriptional regulator n=1 Tax=Ancylobacter sp. sgz301288 TaxID=3342077 RepID=UPI00385F56A5